jgi:hypothetical protein
MKRLKLIKISLLCMTTVGLFIPPVTWAENFPEAGIDITPSLGQFALRLNKEMGDKFGFDCPGNWDDLDDKCVIWSPVLFDFNTKIGRSAEHSDDSNTDKTIGAEICEDGTYDTCAVFKADPVKDKDLKPFPMSGFEEGPADTPEVHTEILSLNMTDLGESDGCGFSSNAVRAGDAMTKVPLAKRKRSLGEVESLKLLDILPPPDDFPAESFFNMFVEVDLDWAPGGGPEMTVYNDSIPLTVYNSKLEGFPPQVIYVHGGSMGAAPVRDVETDKLVGWIVLAGHGVGGEGGSCWERELFAEQLRGMLPKILITEPWKIELGSFEAQVDGGKVTLNWVTDSETNNAAFKIWRGKLLPGKTACTLNVEDYSPQTVQVRSLVNARGNKVSGAEYTYIDTVEPGIYCYALEDIEYDATEGQFHFPNEHEPVIVQ